MSPKKKRINKQNPVGNFFERVTQRMVGGELVRNDDGDIVIERENTTVEVKSSGVQSSYGFRLSLEQLAHYERISNGFPYDRMWYVFLAYSNPLVKDENRGKWVTALSKHTTVPSIERYVASSLSWCLLVDLSIVRQWKETLPHSDKSVMGHRGMKTVDLHAKRVIYPFTNGGLVDGMKGLGFEPDAFRVLSGLVKTTVELGLYDRYPILVPLRVVVPSSELPVVERVLRRQGARLREQKYF